MKRRGFLHNSALGILGTGFLSSAHTPNLIDEQLDLFRGSSPKNIIFLVSDGMSHGTLNMACHMRYRMEGRASYWTRLYMQNKARRALMDMSSASSMVTDSAAASSSWGGGVRVKNGSLNTNEDGTQNTPILQKFKNSGKSVGCVTTVPITHATPAGFCIANKTRGDQGEIALQYLPLKFDVMMGGGSNFFDAEKRKDKQDVFGMFAKEGYHIVRSRDEMMAIKTISPKKPILGTFYNDGLPHTIDRNNSKELQTSTPTLSEMAAKALEVLSQNKKGFFLQIEAGKVDWAAHANDATGLIFDQLSFDDTIKVATDFADKNKDTLVVITTDHGNANPGLFYGTEADKNFDKLPKFTHSNEWILKGFTKESTVAQVIDRHMEATQIALKPEEAKDILSYYTTQEEGGVYNAYKLPYKALGAIQGKYTSVSWAAVDHSADYVELAMYGEGSEAMPGFMRNVDMHQFLLKISNVKDVKLL
jgi:alkaline phosphatase